MLEKKKYPIQHIISWYFGNCCLRKCFYDDKKLQNHHKKLQLFADKNKGLKMTHREFLWLFNNHLKICNLEDNFKQKMISWKLMERLRDTPGYGNMKITVKGKNILLNGRPLPPREHSCIVCQKLGIH